MKPVIRARKIVLVASLFWMAFITRNNLTHPTLAAEDEKAGVRVLLLVAKDYGLNYFLMRDAFDLYGWTVTQTGVLDKIPVCPPNRDKGIPDIVPDLRITEIGDIADYDAIVIPPGAGNFTDVPDPFGDLIESPEALGLVKRAAENQIPVYATCAGVPVLAAAGVIGDRKVVGSPKFRDRYEAAGATYLGSDHPPVIDGGIITSARGRYYNMSNHMAVATAIENARPKRGRKSHTKKEAIVCGEAGFSAKGLAWARTIGSPRADGGRALCRTADGGFLLTGYTFSPGTGDADILVVKTDAEGKPTWSRSLGGTGTEYGYGCATVADGYLITGYTTSFGAGSKDLYAVKLDLTGKEIWSQTYGGKSWDVGTSVCASPDNGFYLCGFTHSFGSGEEDIYLIKTDGNGRELWSKTYGGERFEMGHSVALTGDGHILIGATTGTYGRGNADFYVIKTDVTGNTIWAKSYGTQGRSGNYGYDRCASLHPTQDGGAVLVGSSGSNDIQDAHVIRINAAGAEMWAKSFGRSPFYDYGTDVQETDDGGFIVAGTAKRIIPGPALYDNQIILNKLDAQGATVWEKTLGSPKVDWASALALLEDGSIVVLGHTTSGDAGSFDACLLKIDCTVRYSHGL